MPSEKLAPLLFIALASAGCAASTSAQSGKPETATAARTERTDPATLAATGEPRRCIPNRSNVSTRPAGDTVLMFRTGSNSWFRNDLRGACPALTRNRTLVFRSASSQHCELDVFEVVDPVSRMRFGSCVLGPFTPVEVPRGTNF